MARMTIDYQALREAAEKATCGEWSLEYGEERFNAGDALIHREVVGYLPICRIEGAHPESGFDEDFQMEQQANAEFIAAANPATVLTLLNELETAKKRIAELEEREILLPERSSMLHRTDFHENYQTVMAYKVSEVIDAIRATGIRIKGE
ncbi:ead/Ea22-like family protein [Escherichia coli]|nr:ead/Ea22-like family protein [Escherichia coli]